MQPGDSITHMSEMDYDAVESAITDKIKAIISRGRSSHMATI